METTPETATEHAARVKSEFLAFKRPQTHEQHLALKRREATQAAAQLATMHAAEVAAS